MKLKAFLQLQGQSATGIAARCGVAVSTITRVARGEKAPSLQLMAKIRAATAGAVRADDFLPPFEEVWPSTITASDDTATVSE